MAQAHATPERLFALFDELGLVHHTVAHAPIFTVAEGRDLKASILGVQAKNLFLKDRSGRLALLSAAQDTPVDLKAFAAAMGVKRFSFGPPELLFAKLGVTPGSVTAFAAINDPAHDVEFVLDAALLADEWVNFHPLRNDLTTRVTPAGLRAFFAALQRDPLVFRFDQMGVPSRIDAQGRTDHVRG